MEISSDEAKLALDVVGDLRTKKTRTNSDRRNTSTKFMYTNISGKNGKIGILDFLTII